MTIEDTERSTESRIYRTLRTVDKADNLEWIGLLRKTERDQGGRTEHRNPVYWRMTFRGQSSQSESTLSEDTGQLKLKPVLWIRAILV